MDFSSIMQAAQDNNIKAQKQNNPVLKTKLSAPKKDHRKVDVDAIRKRLEDERKSKEAPKAKPLAKPPPSSASKAGKHVPASANKNSTTMSKHKRPEEKKGGEKSKYKNKEHEEKHKHFMNKIQKIGLTKPDSKPKSDPPAVKPGGKVKPAESKKRRPTINPPSFTDLLKLAEKVSTSSINMKDKPSSNSQVNGNTSKTKSELKDSGNKTSKTKSELKDSGNKTSKTKSELKDSGNKTSKESNRISSKHCKDSIGKSNHKTEKRKSTCDKSTKDNFPYNNETVSKSKPGDKTKGNKDESTSKVTVTKRPLSSNRNGSEVPAKKPALSAAAMAKLAHREGRGPAPPQQTKLSSSKPQTKVENTTNMVSKKADKGNTSQKSSSQGSSSKENKTSKPTAKSEPVAAVSAWDRLMGASNHKNKEKAQKKASSRYALDSDEDDEDLDGFIDDGDDDVDYSAAIRDIFGYDKSRYRDEDFDDRSMIAKYSDIMKEEVRSTKIAQKEDQKELELEEMEKKKKLMKKMKK